MNRHHGLRLHAFAQMVEALLRRHLENSSAALVDVQHRVIRIEIRIRILARAHLHQRVRPDVELIVEGHFFLGIAIERRAGQSDHNNDNADVHQVAAIPARVASRQQIKRRK